MDDKPVLLVQDNSDDAELTFRALRRASYAQSVAVLGSGAEAVDYLLGTGLHRGRDLRFMPSLVLLDLQAPRAGGLDILSLLRAHARTQLLPVVVLTMSREPDDVLAAYRLGASSYICKPDSLDMFAEVMRQVVHYWLTVNERPRPEELPAP